MRRLTTHRMTLPLFLSALFICGAHGGYHAARPLEAPGQRGAATIRSNPVDKAQMVFVPGGSFIMGSDASELDKVWSRFKWPDDWKQHTLSEQPAHEVEVDGFWIYRRNVTVAQYRRFTVASRRAMPPEPEWRWRDDYPVVNVSWEDAKQYCGWAKARLPFEAEWEYAARGGNTGLDGRPRTIFVWGDDYPTSKVANLADISFRKAKVYHANYHIFDKYDDGYTFAAPVGSFTPNGFGLYDMAGNVLQWCEDRYDREYYSKSPRSNPRGSTTGELRVLRGGAYDTIPAITRISRRLGNNPDIHHNEKGFRCVQER